MVPLGVIGFLKTKKGYGMNNKQPLLSICIPTWNRSKFLTMSLENFQDQLKNVDCSEIELFISDNCSDDDTSLVVEKFISSGLPIKYSRNETNIGADRNFLKCMQWASGKYIWLLGDDDILIPETVGYVLDLIRNKDYGIIHFSVSPNKDNLPEVQEYDDRGEFLKAVSYWITFMSGCVFLKESVALVKNYEKYISTCLLQVPFYVVSSSLCGKNLFVRKPVMQNGLDASSNGGYNFYRVFVENYLNIWQEFVDEGLVSPKCYEYIKEDICINFITKFNWNLLIRRKNLASKGKRGFEISGAWRILLKHYGKKLYFWKSFVTFCVKRVWRKVC